MDFLDLSTRLPPRKRLLAGLKKNSSDCDLLRMIPSISSELYDRFHKVINSSLHSIEEIIEEVNSVALDAAEAAEAARANAMEKAAVAAKAKAAAKSALELLDLVKEDKDQRLCDPVKSKLRKRKVGHVETDEEIARRLHRSMNSSPRISNKLDRKNESLRKLENGSESVVEFKDKSKGNLSNRKRKLHYTVEKQYGGSKIVLSKKVNVKRKKLSLSQFNVTDRGKPEEILHSVDNALIGGSMLDSAKSFNEIGEDFISVPMKEVPRHVSDNQIPNSA